MAELLETENEFLAVERLHEMGATDGLPVIVPTRDRVDAMVERVGLDPDLLLGEMGPKQGAATVEKAAISAVMAGCLPDHFPIVVAAIRAVCRDEFDLTEVVQTTHGLAPLILVNGPARQECGDIRSGFGILGPGDRAAASIGRALSLAIINIAGRRAGVTDLAIFSSPANFTCCLAEAEGQSPFPAYHVAAGFEETDSVVTIIGVEAPHSILLEPTGDHVADSERLIRIIAGEAANPGGTNVYMGGQGGCVVVLNPEHATLLARAGYDRDSIARSICKHAIMPRASAELFYGNLYMDEPGDDDQLPAFRHPDQISLIVAGGPGSYSAVLPGWSYAPHRCAPVSELVEIYPVCDMPFSTPATGASD